MPTGYTSIIQDSKESNYDKIFQQFALQCARAFGALVSMRDDKWDAEIPDEFIASDYYKNGIAQHKKELAIARKRKMSEWDKLAEKDYLEKKDHYGKKINESFDRRAKYQTVLDKVYAFEPPTPEHVHYKEFMIEQIKSSIDFDCSSEYYTNELKNLKRLSAKEFKDQTIETIINSLKYDEENYAKEIESAKKRTAWVKALKKSLGIKPNGVKVKS